jgi:hypothetical protein
VRALFQFQIFALPYNIPKFCALTLRTRIAVAAQEYSLAWSLMKEMPVMRPYLFNPDAAVTMFVGKPGVRVLGYIIACARLHVGTLTCTICPTSV